MVDITIKYLASPQLLGKQVLSQFLIQIPVFYKKLYSWENFQNYTKFVRCASELDTRVHPPVSGGLIVEGLNRLDLEATKAFNMALGLVFLQWLRGRREVKQV